MKFNKLSPWETYYNEINAMFKWDKDVQVVFNEAARQIVIYVENDAKASALAELLPKKKEFGTVELEIEVVPADEFITAENIYDMAFRGNPAVADIITTTGVFKATYIVFKCEVVQYFDDNIGDIFGNCSTLYQDIAKNIFNQKEGVFYCTDRA